MSDFYEQSDHQKMMEALRDVGTAFLGGFTELREIQTQVIPLILRGQNLLVCASTATGKTEAILAPLIRRIRLTPLETAKSGPHLLAIAPTRALVNDLGRRIERPCTAIGWRVGAQTSDHRDAARKPDLLITTPESFDSMLARRSIFEGDTFTGHLLAGVRAVFMDEAHCFDGTPRGDQLRFLMERLHRLRKLALEKGWVQSSSLQDCGASATVPDGQALAKRLLGPEATAAVLPGGRDIEVILSDGSYLKLDGGVSPANLVGRLETGFSIERFSARLIAAFRTRTVNKVLIFVPSRALCDSLAERLHSQVQPEIHAWIGAHHGSLSQSKRETAEREFSTVGRRAVLVATSTLEVGVDIGDVDVVVLFGPPPDVSGLLQRVGRGGRRSGVIRLIPIAQDAEEAFALASMLCAAASGQLDRGEKGRHWGVFIQQIASYIAQNRAAGRPASTLVDLAAAVWPNADTRDIAQRLINSLTGHGILHETNGRLHMDETLAKRAESWGGFLHSNIRSGSSLIAVRDNVSGEIIGHVSSLPESSSVTNVGGVAREVVRRSGDEVFVGRPGSDAAGRRRETAPARYPTVPFEISRVYASHVARGIGLGPCDAPWIEDSLGRLVWFHFGGQIAQRLLARAHPDVFQGKISAGIADRIADTSFSDHLQDLADAARVEELLRSIATTSPAGFRKSSFDDFIADDIFPDVAFEVVKPESIAAFFGNLNVFRATDRADLPAKLLELM